MKNLNKYKIYPILSDNELLEALLFLKKKFKWSNLFFKNFYNKIKKNIHKQNKYGYYLKINNVIIGAIIFIYQNEEIFLGNKKNLISLSSWFMDESARGNLPIIFLFKVLEENKDAIITSFSHNYKASIIYKSLGFKEIKTFNIKLNFIEILIK